VSRKNGVRYGLAVVALAATLTACGGRGQVEGRVLISPSTSAVAAATTSPVQTPATTTGAGTTAAPSVDRDLQTLDSQLAGVQAAIDDYDQMTATTEGDPSR
jgi:hypothetical protein